MKQFPPFARSALWLLLAVASFLSMGFYATNIWGANQPPSFSDLYAPWLGSHELLINHRDPYSPAVAHEIQAVIYGTSVPPSTSDPLALAGGFAYPPFTAFLLWPIARQPFSSARVFFLWSTLLGTFLAMAVWLRLFAFRLIALSTLTIAVFTLGSFPALQAIRLQNLTLIAAAILAFSVFLLSTNFQILAGVSLAASTFKPQFVLLLIPWLALWAFSDWRRRRDLVWSFLASVVLLLLASEWILPGSTRRFLKVAWAYRHYTYGHSLLDVWFTPIFGQIAALALLFGIAALSWRLRLQPANSDGFLLSISLMLAATLVVIPTLAPHAQLLLFPGVLCLLRHRTRLRVSGRLPRFLWVAAWTLLAWPWTAAAGLVLATLWAPVNSLLRWWQVPLYTTPLMPLGLLAPLLWLARHTGTTDIAVESVPNRSEAS
jgi:Glycosyltransferase family 87